MRTASELLGRALADAAGERAVVLIDGGSGAGKTTLASDLVAAWRVHDGTPAQLVSLDEAYQGWGGLAQASRAVSRDMLRAADPGFTTWDWAESKPGPWRALDPAHPLVIEGCGAISHESARLATTRVWVELHESSRQRRALARPADVGVFEDFWEMWAAQEREHWRRNAPYLLADERIDGRTLS